MIVLQCLIALAIVAVVVVTAVVAIKSACEAQREYAEQARLSELRRRADLASYALNKVAFGARQAIFDAALEARRDRTH